MSSSFTLVEGGEVGRLNASERAGWEFLAFLGEFTHGGQNSLGDQNTVSYMLVLKC